MKKLFSFLILFTLSACGNSQPDFLPVSDGEYVPSITEPDLIYPHVDEPYYADVKYAEETVEITPTFISCDTSSSSWIRSATYDPSSQYLILDLSGTKYHYCALPFSVYDAFCTATSLGSYYNQNIKGNYACQ